MNNNLQLIQSILLFASMFPFTYKSQVQQWNMWVYYHNAVGQTSKELVRH